MNESGNNGVREKQHERAPEPARMLEREPLEFVRTTAERREPTAEEILRNVERTKQKHAARKRWGRILMILGVVTILDSCSFFPIPLIGPPAIFAGAIMMIVGSIISYQAPRLRETNEALLVAMKYNNRLTVARLALEMDITLQHAEEIIQELIENGIAEIDVDMDAEDVGILYRIRGI